MTKGWQKNKTKIQIEKGTTRIEGHENGNSSRRAGLLPNEISTKKLFTKTELAAAPYACDSECVWVCVGGEICASYIVYYIWPRNQIYDVVIYMA